MADESENVDAEMMAAMGFSGFGMQAKKRKFGDADAFVEPSNSSSNQQQPHHPGTRGGGVEHARADAQTVYSVKTAAVRSDKDRFAVAKGKANAAVPIPQNSATTGVDEAREPTMEALRHGFRNENGDTVIFLQSFIEGA